jgi:hypothetical protein
MVHPPNLSYAIWRVRKLEIGGVMVDDIVAGGRRGSGIQRKFSQLQRMRRGVERE